MKAKSTKLAVPMGAHPHAGPNQTSQQAKKPGVRKVKTKGKR